MQPVVLFLVTVCGYGTFTNANTYSHGRGVDVALYNCQEKDLKNYKETARKCFLGTDVTVHRGVAHAWGATNASYDRQSATATRRSVARHLNATQLLMKTGHTETQALAYLYSIDSQRRAATLLRNSRTANDGSSVRHAFFISCRTCIADRERIARVATAIAAAGAVTVVYSTIDDSEVYALPRNRLRGVPERGDRLAQYVNDVARDGKPFTASDFFKFIAKRHNLQVHELRTSASIKPEVQKAKKHPKRTKRTQKHRRYKRRRARKNQRK
ncbi:hypothetical protein CYMTET_37640 [Cymbomonas tetramitiformis]|uniref:Uncharacterized protein n=1 Tax=Cymbomonas tetramitiformis TaxID=36881 RepID=A0AAE0CFQ6_9CHLO|nr:hypothetical protein CYMTET_37640 [Cymbomonas tetramitiformis]